MILRFCLNVIPMSVLNFVKEPKTRVYCKELEERAIEFHGHGGPFMIVGLRMGLSALNHLDAKGWFSLDCVVKLNWAPPDSCVIDGIQSSTGCTMGKRNIRVDETDGVSARFSYKEKDVTLTLREDVLNKIRSIFDEGDESVNQYMSWLAESDEELIFDIAL